MPSEHRDSPVPEPGPSLVDGAATLARAIDSVLAQQDADFEYILADNRSTDGSSEIAKAYAARDSRVRYCHFDELIPQGPNYNRALRLVSAGARFVKVVQADDFILPGCLARMADLELPARPEKPTRFSAAMLFAPR